MRIELCARLSSIDPAAFDALSGDRDPFVEHAFLDALEVSGSVGGDSGWEPIHVLAYDDRRLVGALPLYAKDHSWGEFIFDFAWARAAQRARISYYPKLVSMAPFTPATGRRFLIAEGADEARVVATLLEGAKRAAHEVGASSIHLLYLTAREREHAIAGGLRPRLSLQFHWDNDGYASFDDYLRTFRSEKRKQVNRERRRVAESGIRIETKSGGELDDRDWQALARFYRLNCGRHGSHPYLTPAFFDQLRARHAHRVVAVLAYDAERPIAVSLSFEKGPHLYGRYWGAGGDYEFLHFELCYYRPIERAIERGMTHFEAGAQGYHKLKRGLLPVEVHSAHWVRDPMLARAVDEFLPLEAMEVREQIELLDAQSPLRRG